MGWQRLRSRLALGTLMVCVACSARDAQPEQPTFARDVAPIVHGNCAPCHRPGEQAPFSLLTYRDVQRRGRQILEVTASGFMPPWLPAPGKHALRNARGLSNLELQTLERWVATGSPEGDPEDLPALPEWPSDWHLGEPDLVLVAAEAFELYAEGDDVFRNMILPFPGNTTRSIRAMQFRPGSSGAVHHAIIQMDSERRCRSLAAEDAPPGFPGMSMGPSEPPDGHFLGWTPGKGATETEPEMAWRLAPGSDLVVQLHMTPTGKREEVRPSIGLYFAEKPPTRFPHSIVLYSEAIDIPAGEPQHLVVDEFVLPVDVELLSVYPHAHYVGSSVHVTARLSTGTDELMRIDAWDFNWQDEYRYAEPVYLPAGTTLRMEWIYNNSSSNPRNPHRPPQRIRFGERSVDEMGTATLVVLPRDPSQLPELKKARWRHVLEKAPHDVEALNQQAILFGAEGRLAEAIGSLQRALEYQPEYGDGWNNLGLMHLRRQEPQLAIQYLRRALSLDGTHAGANANLGAALAQAGLASEARTHLESVLTRMPQLVAARVQYANLLAVGGNPQAAVEQYRIALATRDDLPEAFNNLANTYLALEQPERAIPLFERALALRSNYFNAHLNLGRTLVETGERERGVEHLREALRLQPGSAFVRQTLEEAVR